MYLGDAMDSQKNNAFGMDYCRSEISNHIIKTKKIKNNIWRMIYIEINVENNSQFLCEENPDETTS